MRIGIIGKGHVGSALETGWTVAGHDVRAGGRTTTPPAHEIAAWADVIVLAVPYAAIPEVVELNIGHFLIGEGIFVGLDRAVAQMRALMADARAMEHAERTIGAMP